MYINYFKLHHSHNSWVFGNHNNPRSFLTNVNTIVYLQLIQRFSYIFIYRRAFIWENDSKIKLDWALIEVAIRWIWLLTCTSYRYSPFTLKHRYLCPRICLNIYLATSLSRSSCSRDETAWKIKSIPLRKSISNWHITEHSRCEAMKRHTELTSPHRIYLACHHIWTNQVNRWRYKL